MNDEKFAEEVLRKDFRIRYLEISDDEFHILFSKMREGVQTITTEEEERSFLQLLPATLVDTESGVKENSRAWVM